MREATGIWSAVAKAIVVTGSFCLLFTFFFAQRILNTNSFSCMLFQSLLLFLTLTVVICICCFGKSRFASLTRKIVVSSYTTLFALFLIIFVMGWRHHGFHTTSAVIFSSLRESSMLLAQSKGGVAGLPSKKKLFTTNLKLTIEQLWHKDSYSSFTTSIGNYVVSAFHYSTLRFLFQEIFIGQPYVFQADTHQPFIIDCGSNIGISVLFFKTLYPQASVLAFEADPRTYDMLQKNITQNQLEYVTAINKAVSYNNAPITFYFNSHTPGHPCMSTSAGRRFIVREEQTVQATVLSQYIDKPVDFLKLDIEGAELAVLKELAHKNKLSMIKEMVIEYHHHLEGQDRLSELLKILEIHGFGYQISADLHLPSEKDIFQDLLVYVYKK